MGFKDKEEMLDALYEHLAEDDNPDDEYDSWFEEHVVKFFDFLDEGTSKNPPRRRPRSSSSSNDNNSARRKRRQSSNAGNAGSSYGAKSWFGN